jgi:hypothetical protein
MRSTLLASSAVLPVFGVFPVVNPYSIAALAVEQQIMQ